MDAPPPHNVDLERECLACMMVSPKCAGYCFAALDSGDFNCVASGTTITGSRALKAAFCDPYLISGQALAVDATGQDLYPRIGYVDCLQ